MPTINQLSVMDVTQQEKSTAPALQWGITFKKAKSTKLTSKTWSLY